MYCKNCGREIIDGEKNCAACGTPVGGSETIYERPQRVSEKIGMMSAYKLMFKNYAKFSGRSRRSEYWYASLMNFIIVMAAWLLNGVLMGAGAAISAAVADTYSSVGVILFGISGIIGFLLMIYSIALIIPGLALVVRRLHDIGKSGWYMLLSLIPIIGGIIMLVFMVTDSQPGANQYGENPKGF